GRLVSGRTHRRTFPRSWTFGVAMAAANIQDRGVMPRQRSNAPSLTEVRNAAQPTGVNTSTGPAWSFESRTATASALWPTSTHAPLAWLRLLLRQKATSTHAPLALLRLLL